MIVRFLFIAIAALDLLSIGKLVAQTSTTLPNTPQSKGGALDLVYSGFDAAFLKRLWCRKVDGRIWQLAFISRDGSSVYVGRRLQTYDWNVTQYPGFSMVKSNNEFTLLSDKTYKKTVCASRIGQPNSPPDWCGTFPTFRDGLLYRWNGSALLEFNITLNSFKSINWEMYDEAYNDAIAKPPLQQWELCDNAAPTGSRALAGVGFSELRACIGERDGGCGRKGSVKDWGGVYDKRYACYTPYESIARDMGCLKRDGLSLRRYDVDTIKPKADGGQCGYEWVRVRCYDE